MSARPADRINLPVAFVLLLLAPAARAQDAVNGFVPIKSVTAASVLPGKADRYAPIRAIDFNSDTAWCEGAPDEGVGQSWTLTFDAPVVVDEVELEPGMRKSQKLFAANNLPTRLEVKGDDGKPVSASSKNWERPIAKLSGKPTRQLTITFAEVEKRALNDTCLTDISIKRGGSHLSLITNTSRAALAALPAAVRELSRALKTCDAAALGKMVRFPLSYVQGQEGNAPPLKYRYRDVAALVKGCKKKQAPGGNLADEHVQNKPLDELLGRRERLDEVVVDPFWGAEIGQDWHLVWNEARGWQLIDVE